MTYFDRYGTACDARMHLAEREPTMNSSDGQSPSKLEHLIDADIDPKTGECSYFYNYLLYTFEHAGTKITARGYLDDISEVSILNCPPGIDMASELSGILAYLRLRYSSVKYLGPSGYIEI